MADQVRDETPAQSPATAEGTSPAGAVDLSEYIPKKDFLAHKEASARREAKLKSELEARGQELESVKGRLNELDGELAFLKDNPPEDATDGEIRAYKLKLQAKEKQILTVQSSLLNAHKEIKAERARIDAERREQEIKDMAARYKLTAEELERVAEADDPEKESLRIAYGRNGNGSAAGNPKPPKTEHGSPNRGHLLPRDMTRDQFREHLAKMQREASAR